MNYTIYGKVERTIRIAKLHNVTVISVSHYAVVVNGSNNNISRMIVSLISDFSVVAHK